LFSSAASPVHTAPQHASFPQDRPQTPQLAGSFVRLRHVPSQQVSLKAHVFPHTPQFCGSDSRSVQPPSQQV
jgi:hypothetical protein